MNRPRFHTAIDVGTTKVCVLIGSVGLSGKPEVAGVGFQVSRGLRKGTVINIPEAQAAIQLAVQEAERQAGVRIREALVGVTGNHILSQNVVTHWECDGGQGSVTARDLEQILHTSYTLPLEPAKRLLHAIPRSYVLDGQPRVRNPVGMHASLMDVETHIVTAAQAPVDNLIQAVEGAGVGVQGLVLEPLASSEAVMSADEREIGCVLVDIGGGTSDIAIFKNGSIWYTGVIPVGGYQLTNDLSIGLTIPYSAAEDLKVRYGHTLPDEIDGEPMVEIPRLGSGERQEVSLRAAAEILRDRCQELLRLVVYHVHQSNLDRFSPAGVVFTGGSAILPGLVELAAEFIPGPVRVGAPRGIVGNAEALESPKFATSVGILLWGVRHHRRRSPGTNGHSHPLQRLLQRLLMPRRRRFTLRHPQNLTQ